MAALISLLGLLPEEIRALIREHPPFRAKQIFKWINRGVSSFHEMTDLALPLREDLHRRFSIRGASITNRLTGGDGTEKLQLRLADGAKVETVLLSGGEGRKTACLSTQAGCPVGCVFCKTGSMGFLRNLSAAEILEQFFLLKGLHRNISNIVIMGMGEPLLNLAELRRALTTLFHPEGLFLSHRRVTVSTCGIVPGIEDLSENGPNVGLALSLTTADDDLRSLLMPITQTYKIPELRKALSCYQRKGGGRITLEAVLLKGINTRKKDARAMISFAAGLETIVNLIPWNPVEGLTFEGKPLESPSHKEVGNFAELLESGGLKVTLRYRKGRSVAGACGQLGEVLCGT
jgi:23S rRNA (adenine2503-C2)-methyltransferase